MKRLLIVGAGGFGREVLCWALHVERTQSEWKVGGFLDANPVALDGLDAPFGILGDPYEFRPTETDLYLCAIGDPATKQRLVTCLLARGAHFANLIHPSTVIGLNCHIGEGTVVCPGAVVTTNVRLGRFVTLNVAATVGHDANVGDWCTLSGHVDITGKATLGEAVFAGTHACVLPGLRVGDHAVIGAGSVVTRNVPAGHTMFGVPARMICSTAAQ